MTEELSFIKLKRDTKFWEESTFLFKNSHKEFDKFWPELLKVPINFPLMGFLWAKYILFSLKKYRRVIFHESEEGCKIWRVINLSFQNWQKEFDKFWPEHSKISKFLTLVGFFWTKYILFQLKKYRGIIFH